MNSDAAVAGAERQRVAGGVERELRRRRRRVRLEEHRRLGEVDRCERCRSDVARSGTADARGADERLRIAERDAGGGEAREHAVDVVAAGAAAKHHAESAARADAGLRRRSRRA